MTFEHGLSGYPLKSCDFCWTYTSNFVVFETASTRSGGWGGRRQRCSDRHTLVCQKRQVCRTSPALVLPILPLIRRIHTAPRERQGGFVHIYVQNEALHARRMLGSGWGGEETGFVDGWTWWGVDEVDTSWERHILTIDIPFTCFSYRWYVLIVYFLESARVKCLHPIYRSSKLTRSRATRFTPPKGVSTSKRTAKWITALRLSYIIVYSIYRLLLDPSFWEKQVRVSFLAAQERA